MLKNILIPFFKMVLFTSIISSFSSCLVSKKKFDAEVKRANQLTQEKQDLLAQLSKTEDSLKLSQNENNELSKALSELKTDRDRLTQAEKKCKEDLQLLQKQYDELNHSYDELSKKSGSEKEKLSIALAEKEKMLNLKEAELNKVSSALNEREKRVNELESLIAKKDEAVSALKKKIADALAGFSSDELNVVQKDGKVYVSMSDKLLFKSGSFVVDEKGRQALLKVAEVLNKQKEISIEVEGHTDNKQYLNPKGDVKNNWDLSAMRASAVSLLLVGEGKVDPMRVTASGHSEYFPVESNETAEGRSKNRRTEIVLTPDLREIMKILNGDKN